MPARLSSNVALNNTVASLWSSLISSGTFQVYTAGFQAYCTFLILNSITWTGNVPPVSEDFLIYFVAHCVHSLRIKLCTIKTYLCGIRYHYLRHGCPNPLEPPNGGVFHRLHTVLCGAKKLQGTTRRTRLPITSDIMRHMCRLLRGGAFSPFIDLMLETASIIAFCGFLRCSEFCITGHFDSSRHLCLNDVSVCNNTHNVSIHLKVSKCDPFRKGITVTLFKSHTSICPFNCVSRYLSLRRSLFDCHDLSPFFVDDCNRPLTRHMFVSYIKAVLDRLKLNSVLYNGHSFRIGAATSAAKAGVPDHLIKTLGRWSSDCYQRYIFTSQASIKRAQTSMLS